MQIIGFLLIAIIFAYLERKRRPAGEPFPWVYLLFFFSGFPALFYQIVWERALFAIYGVNVESVTVVVTAFMLGLGLGSLAGGRISRLPLTPLLAYFGMAELGTGAFGIVSLKAFNQIAHYTAGASLLSAAALSFGMLLIPTMLMGSTLPLLVEYVVRGLRNVGQSIGLLYFANTLGSALACFVAAELTMRLLGQSGSVILGSTINILVGSGALMLYVAQRAISNPTTETSKADTHAQTQSLDLVKFPFAVAVVAATGFLALAYEIIWYRLLSFESGSSAKIFAYLLGAYLLGISIGGIVAHRLCIRSNIRSTNAYLRLTGALLALASGLGFFVPSLAAFAARYHPPGLILIVIITVAALLAAVFPLICHVSLTEDGNAGSGLSVLYFSNIGGSALGSFLVGFVLMNLWGIQRLSVFLALLGIGLGFALLTASGSGRRQLLTGLTAAALACTSVIFLANPLFGNVYERLLYKVYYSRQHFQHLIENSSGVIAVDQGGSVYGGGAYDGAFSLDPVHDVNGVFRPYFLSAFHPRPSEVLTIGLSSGSWAQIIANHPEVQHETIVEINPGYLELIPGYPQVASLLHNAKVKIIIDDGRRWLLANPDRRFDLILMNTTFNWREHTTNLLSVEFLQLARKHLRPGGILYYNTTSSEEVLLTGTTVFPYGLRVGNFLAVSDSPIVLHATRLRKTLLTYRIDDRLVFDPAEPVAAQRLEEIIGLTHRFAVSDDNNRTIETADSIRARCHGKRIITDDNMGTEWSS